MEPWIMLTLKCDHCLPGWNWNSCYFAEIKSDISCSIFPNVMLIPRSRGGKGGCRFQWVTGVHLRKLAAVTGTQKWRFQEMSFLFTAVIFRSHFNLCRCISLGNLSSVFFLWHLHPGRLTWNIIMEVWKSIFLSIWVICRFHVNLPGCTCAKNMQNVHNRVQWWSRIGFENCEAVEGIGHSSKRDWPY